ncbi:MAG: HmuY family protein [Lentimicrobium sp.]|nr:HmuY family protein [Lentimicrobium sp.]
MKRQIKTASILLISIVTLTSCFKEDEIVVPQKPGNVETVVIEMLPDYTIQSFFSLSEGDVKASNHRTDWDIAMSTKPGDLTLWLNTSIFMYAARTGISDFSVPLSTTGWDWRFDASTGNPEGNAIGKWWNEDAKGISSNEEVILIDRGIDPDGLPLGFLKIQPLIDPVTQEVSLRIAKPDGSQEKIFQVSVDPLRRFVTVSFENGYNNPQIEPQAEQWDLLFTTYTTLLFTDAGDPYPYLVNGVLLNDTLVQAVLDTVVPFAEIDRERAESLTLSSSGDVIGYDWKEINGDVTSGNITYTVRSHWNYIIRDRNGLYYKLRFIDFYNNLGKKGYPTFEFQRL